MIFAPDPGLTAFCHKRSRLKRDQFGDIFV